MTIRVGHEPRSSDDEIAKNGKSLLQVLSGFHNPCQAENLSVLLRFSLDSEGDIDYWCRQVLACICESQHQTKLITLIARSFVENCEFKEQQYRGLKTDLMVAKFFEQRALVKRGESEKASDDFSELNLCIYVLIRDNKLLELRQRFEQ